MFSPSGSVGGAAGDPGGAVVEAALAVLGQLPPPAACALGLAVRDGAGAGGAADGEEALPMQRIDGHVVGGGEGHRVRAGPVEDGVQFHQPARLVMADEGEALAMVGLIGPQARHPAPRAR